MTLTSGSRNRRPERHPLRLPGEQLRHEVHLLGASQWEIQPHRPQRARLALPWVSFLTALAASGEVMGC